MVAARGVLLVLVLLGSTPAFGRVVLVGVDGLCWTVAEPMLAAGEMPHLAALVERGVAADLATVEPLISPTVWSSVATGRSPEAHGVTGFLSSRFSLRVPTVFDRLAASGVRVGLYEYLVTWPPQELPDGFSIPGWLRRDAGIAPRDAWERAGVAPFRVDYDTIETREEHAALALREVREKPAAWEALVRAFDPQVGVVTLYAVDRVSHRWWRDAYPDGASGGLPREGSVLREVMRGLDAGLGRIAGTLSEEDVLLVASDHGFQAGEARAVWVGRTRAHLAAAGLDPERDAFTVVREWGAILVRVHPGPFAERDAAFARLVDFYRSIRTSGDGGGDALYRVMPLDEAERPAERRRPWWDRLRQRVVRVGAARLFGVRFDEPAHGWIVVYPKDGVLEDAWPDAPVEIAGRRVAIQEVVFREDFDGDHLETAVFMAAGGPIRALPERRDLSVLVVAPLVAHLAGRPVPDDMEGAVPSEWLEPAALAARPVQRVPAAEAPRLPEGERWRGHAGGDEALRERLRSLGYVE